MTISQAEVVARAIEAALCSNAERSVGAIWADERGREQMLIAARAAIAAIHDQDGRQDTGAPERWQPIETAPRDGQHILACDAQSSFGWMNGGPLPPVQTVVHWWSNPGEEGFYTSVNELAPEKPFHATHWKFLNGPGTASGIEGREPVRRPNPSHDQDDLREALEGGTLSLTSFDGHCVRIDFETRDEAEKLFDRLSKGDATR